MTTGIPHAAQKVVGGAVYAVCPACGERVRLMTPKDEDSMLTTEYAEHYRRRHGPGAPSPRFIIRSRYNPKLILTTNGDYFADSMVGPGGRPAKVFKTLAGAERHAARVHGTVAEEGSPPPRASEATTGYTGGPFGPFAGPRR